MSNFADRQTFTGELDSLQADVDAFAKMDPFDSGFDETYRSLERRRATVEAALSKQLAGFQKRIEELEALASC